MSDEPKKPIDDAAGVTWPDTTRPLPHPEGAIIGGLFIPEAERWPRCGTCRHWDLREYLGGGYGLCLRIDEDALLARLRVGHEGADLTTQANFGCVLHEEAE